MFEMGRTSLDTGVDTCPVISPSPSSEAIPVRIPVQNSKVKILKKR